MRYTSTRHGERRGFTLVELLVVIAIIGVLVSLLAAAVMPLLSKGPQVQAVSDIRQLSAALESFKTKFGGYPPSRIRLLESGQYVPTNQLDSDSKNFLVKCWPNIQFPIDWNGDGQANGDWILEGHQCLVFFLGGLQLVPDPARPLVPGEPVNGVCIGFSNDPRNPAKFTGPRIDPFFQFDPSRLVLPVTAYPPGYPAPTWPQGLNWLGLAYRDPFGTTTLRKTPAGAVVPDVLYYAYFSSYNRTNGYNKYGTTLSDCMSLGIGGVWPYAQSAPTPVMPARYYNPNTYQIISAGRDGIFGTGNVHPPGFGVQNNAATPDRDQGADDFSNFAGAALGGGL